MTIEFDVREDGSPDEFKSRKILGPAVTPPMVTWLVKRDIAKNEQQAAYILLAVAVIIFALAGFGIYEATGNHGEPLDPNKLRDQMYHAHL